MRMKLYTAATREDAVALMKTDMGTDAVILSERDIDEGYEVRAAVERATSIVAPNFAQKNKPAPSLQISRYRENLREILNWHGAPDGFSEVIAVTGSRLVGVGSRLVGVGSRLVGACSRLVEVARGRARVSRLQDWVTVVQVCLMEV